VLGVDCWLFVLVRWDLGGWLFNAVFGPSSATSPPFLDL